MVEGTETASGNVGHDAVEHQPAPLVLVEAGVEKFPQKPTALGHPEAISQAQDRGTRGPQRVATSKSVLECRDQIPHGSETQPVNHRILRLVDQFIKVSGTKPGRQFQFHSRHGMDFHGIHVGDMQLELLARNGHTRICGAFPPGQGGLFQALGNRSVGGMMSSGDAEAGFSILIGADFIAHRSGDGSALLAGHRGLQPHAPIALEDLAVPAAPDQRKPLPHQKTISRILRIVGEGCVIEKTQGQFASAVVHIVENGAIAALQIPGSQDIQIRLEFDLSRGVDGDQIQIDQSPVLRLAGVDGKVDLSHYSLVLAYRPKRLPAGKGPPFGDFKTQHTRLKMPAQQHHRKPFQPDSCARRVAGMWDHVMTPSYRVGLHSARTIRESAPTRNLSHEKPAAFRWCQARCLASHRDRQEAAGDVRLPPDAHAYCSHSTARNRFIGVKTLTQLSRRFLSGPGSCIFQRNCVRENADSKALIMQDLLLQSRDCNPNGSPDSPPRQPVS